MKLPAVLRLEDAESLTGDERRKRRPHQPLFLFGRCFFLSPVDVLKVPLPRVDGATPIFGPDRRPGTLLELRQDAVEVVDILGDVRDELVERIEAAKESLAECTRRILFDFFPELGLTVRQFFRFTAGLGAVEHKQAQLLGVLARVQVFPLGPRTAGLRLGRTIALRQFRPVTMADQADHHVGLIDGVLDRQSVGQGARKIPLAVGLGTAMVLDDPDQRVATLAQLGRNRADEDDRLAKLSTHIPPRSPEAIYPVPNVDRAIWKVSDVSGSAIR
jgi:hypothetical protein